MRDTLETLARLNAYRRAHPDVEIYQAGLWRAWIPKQGGDKFEGTEVEPQRHLADLLDRLERLG